MYICHTNAEIKPRHNFFSLLFNVPDALNRCPNAFNAFVKQSDHICRHGPERQHIINDIKPLAPLSP